MFATDQLTEFFAVADLWAFYLACAAVALWEMWKPRRPLDHPIRLRWLHNLSLTIFNTIVLSLLFPAGALVIAIEVQREGWGLFNLLQWHYWLEVAICFVLLDLSFYAKHRLAHAVPWLWRIHRVHHTDLDFDFTTALRFHPLDAAYQALLLSATIFVLGPPPVAVGMNILAFLVLTRFQHGNVFVPEVLDRWLRTVMVTPDMHRIHHGADAGECASNFGGLLPWFDRMLGTYRNEPLEGHDGMQLGQSGFGDECHLTLGWMLANPFLSDTPMLPKRPVRRVS